MRPGLRQRRRARRASLPPGRPSCGSSRFTPRASRSAASPAALRQRVGRGARARASAAARRAASARRSTSAVSSRSSSAADSSRVASTASSVAPYFWVSRKSRSRRRSISASRSGSSCTSSAYAAARRASSDEVGVGGVEQLAPRRRRTGSTFSSAASARSASASAPSALPLLALQRVGDPLRMLRQRAGLAQPARLDLQRLVLARLEPGGVDLVDHVAQVVGPAADLVAPRGERRLLGPERVRAPRAPRPPPPARLRRGRRHRGCRAGRRRGAATGSRAGRGDRPAARRAAPSTAAVVGLPFTQARERPSAETSRRTIEPAVLDVEPERLDPAAGGRVDALERALDDGLGGARPDAAAGGALAEQQGEGIDQHRLPRPGLAGEDVEARAELEGDVGDGGEIADPELGDHRAPTVSPASAADRPSASFCRIRVKKPSPPSRMRHTRWSARRTSTHSPGASVVPVWPSNETSRSSAQPDDRLDHDACRSRAPRAAARASVCAAIGVTTIASTPGHHDRPAGAQSSTRSSRSGVATMMPSAL